ncbi:hypothetical protein EC973_000191 [Apophysomyces ossiformis]|uniref:Amino acid transporter transmembrane domain-containing protein n=1 Tax=Apophysomyces ossiformis TaxID=679940 RepID=A0A8H7BYF7_9FUNG|nr:hypothetical protein EC973_000191 [Apophysomyces ossiformis]
MSNNTPHNHPNSALSSYTEAITIPNVNRHDRPVDHYGSFPDDYSIDDRPVSGSLSERIGSFVGSYSRTSLMHMAENVAVPSYEDHGLGNDEILSVGSQAKTRRNRGQSQDTVNEQTTLLYSSLSKINTNASRATVADSYAADPYIDMTKKSTFYESLFNSVNVLVGIGILALPLGFKCAGWALGAFIFLFSVGVTNYTAKLLAKCMDAQHDSHTYGDMGAAAFGLPGRIGVSILFLTELITGSVALVVLLSDGIDSLFPGHSPLSLRIISFLILTPTVFLPVRHLSYTSLLGIFSVLSVLFVIIVDGFSKPNSPGSLLEPADTTVWPSNWSSLPLSFGLIMAGFAGHGVFPTIYRDMQHPKKYESVVNWSYFVTAIVYATVAICGYLMFGSATMQEITQNLVAVPEYNATLNRIAVWLVSLTPIAKFALTSNPVNISLEILLFGSETVEKWCAKGRWRTSALTIVTRVLVSAIIVTLAYVIPDFHKIMSLLGAFFAYVIAAIFPIVCHLRLFAGTIPAWERVMSWILLILSAVFALSGTIWSFM